MTDDRPTIIVWFSCGAASAVAAFMTLLLYAKTHRVRIVNNIVAEEGIDNRRFLMDVQRWLGVEIETPVHPKYGHCSARQIWEDASYMSGPMGAPCTVKLKKEVRAIFEAQNQCDHIVLGFTAEEKKRHNRFVLTERSNVIPVLIKLGYTKEQCAHFIRAAGIELPEAYKLGYPNANCYGCVKASSPTYWNHVRKVHPHIFADRAEQSRRLGARLVLVKGERKFLDELSPDTKGRPMKQLIMPDCSIYCEEFSKGDA